MPRSRRRPVGPTPGEPARTATTRTAAVKRSKPAQPAQGSRGQVQVRFGRRAGRGQRHGGARLRRTTCKGSCQISIPPGTSCQFTARGYHDKVVRFRELVGR